LIKVAFALIRRDEFYIYIYIYIANIIISFAHETIFYMYGNPTWAYNQHIIELDGCT